jgi:hypothetical protein
MLGGMAIVSDVRLEGDALAQVFWSRLQNTKILPIATHDDYGYEHRHPGQIDPQEPFRFFIHRWS